MSIGMRKILSAVLAVIIAAVIVAGAFPAVQSSALSMIKYKITYTAKYAKLTLTPMDPDNTIYYTVGGAQATQSSKKYTRTVSTRSSVVIRASEYTGKGVKVAAIKLTLTPKVAAPSVTEKDGKLTAVSATPGASVYYTTDGSVPTSSSQLYSAPIKALPGTIVRFRAFRNGCTASKSTAYYTNEDISRYDFAVSDEQIKTLDLMNLERAKIPGLCALHLDETLCRAASVRAKEIAVSFSHDRPGGGKYSDILREYGIDNIYSAENIAVGYTDPYDVMDGWMNSQMHRKNILGENYDHVGIGIYVSVGLKHWAEIFGGLD